MRFIEIKMLHTMTQEEFHLYLVVIKCIKKKDGIWERYR